MLRRAVLPGLFIGAALWFLLYVILGVSLWVSFVAAGGALVVCAAASGVILARGREDQAVSPYRPADHRGPIGQIYDLLRAPLRVTGLVISAGVFVILYPVIGVTLWVSILAAGALYAFESMVEDRAFPSAVVGAPRSRGGRPGLQREPDLDVSVRHADGSAESREAPRRPRDSAPVAH